MAYTYFSRKREAIRFADVLLNESGWSPSIFRDGRSYRVQSDLVGANRTEELLRQTFGANWGER